MNHVPFAEKIKELRATAGDRSALPSKVRIRILRNFTIENIEPLIQYACAKQGQIDAAVTFSDFDAFEQEILDPESRTNAEKYDIIVLSLWIDGLIPNGAQLSTDEVAERMNGLLARLKKNASGVIAVTTFLAPFWALGSSRVGSDTVMDRISAINSRIVEMAAVDSRIQVIDLHRIGAQLGDARTTDIRFWYLYRSPLHNDALAHMADEISTLAMIVLGRRKKVLVLDCDGTLWGGVVGEDGTEGVALDSSKYPGSAFVDFHRQILELKKEGIVLAICSKNNEVDALSLIASHPHSLLRPSDFVIHKINWLDKASNIREIAQELNLGLDSFVFIDDSPVECELVRKFLPEVTVLRVPDRPCDLPSLLRKYQGFNRVGASREDGSRTQLYQEEAQRNAVKSQFDDIDAYLASLSLAAVMAKAGASDITRVSQLTQKTNQFNLTTKRYSENDIDRFVSSQHHAVITMTVRDRFGDYGLTGLGILAEAGGEVVIDTLLMSCRVLGRKLEFALLGQLVSATLRFFPRARVLKGLFIPSNKNMQAADFYDRAGFECVGGDGVKKYAHHLRGELPMSTHIQVSSLF